MAEFRAQSTRAELLQAIRAQKVDDIATGRIAPEGSDELERIASCVEDLSGLHSVVGSLATGSGVALELAYHCPFVCSDAFVHASASKSTNVHRFDDANGGPETRGQKRSPQ